MTDDVEALAERLRLAQREDVIETLARAYLLGCGMESKSIDDIQEYKGETWLNAIDAIIRSLPSREAIIEEVKAKIDYHMNDRLIDLKPEMDDSITGFNDAWAVVNTAIRSLAEHPRSNSVEDGAGRNGSERNPPQKAVIDTEQSGHVPSPTLKEI